MKKEIFSEDKSYTLAIANVIFQAQAPNKREFVVYEDDTDQEIGETNGNYRDTIERLTYIIDERNDDFYYEVVISKHETSCAAGCNLFNGRYGGDSHIYDVYDGIQVFVIDKDF
jgi:hypothetical protein